MHPELVSSILSLFTSYIKVPLVWTRVQFDIKGLLGLYGYCYRVTNGTNDNDYELVSSYTVKFGDFPLQIIQNELQTINLQPLVQLLLTTKDIYESGGDPVTLQKQGAFDFEASMDGQFVMKKVRGTFVPPMAQSHILTRPTKTCCSMNAFENGLFTSASVDQVESNNT